MAAPAFRANGAATSGSTSTTVTVNKPAGTVADDLLIAVVTNGGANTAPSTVPAGWTLRTGAGGATWWVGVYYKIAGGSEPATYTWDGFTNSCTGCAVAISGADTGDPIPVYNQQANADGNVACTGITPLVDECLIVAAAGVDDNQGMSGWAVTDPGVLTERAEQLSSGGDDAAAGIATGAQTTAAATGNLSATLAGTRDNSGFLLAVQPPQAGGGTVTGSAVAQLGGLSAVADGDRTVHGAASLAGAFTAAASGMRTVDGLAAATLGGLSATAIGVRSVSGAASATLGGLAATASGVAEGGAAVTGTASATLTLSATATGRRLIQGAAAAALGNLAATAFGAGGTTGSATAYLGTLTATAAGDRTVNGAATAPLGVLAATAAGDRAVRGALASPLMFTAGASGRRTVNGALLASLGGLAAAMVAANGSESGTASAGAPATSTATTGTPATASASTGIEAVPTATGGVS